MSRPLAAPVLRSPVQSTAPRHKSRQEKLGFHPIWIRAEDSRAVITTVPHSRSMPYWGERLVLILIPLRLLYLLAPLFFFFYSSWHRLW
ncbi:hypothetical protein BJX66DRAFT_161204 [Aspergillus keveii]|uniref:Uncharacterized protein n=1 Tax=Aspergillus keveii TaxID=714993 RepID=A0ABR4FHV2_9EURO